MSDIDRAIQSPEPESCPKCGEDIENCACNQELPELPCCPWDAEKAAEWQAITGGAPRDHERALRFHSKLPVNQNQLYGARTGQHTQPTQQASFEAFIAYTEACIELGTCCTEAMERIERDRPATVIEAPIRNERDIIQLEAWIQATFQHFLRIQIEYEVRCEECLTVTTHAHVAENRHESSMVVCDDCWDQIYEAIHRDARAKERSEER